MLRRLALLWFSLTAACSTTRVTHQDPSDPAAWAEAEALARAELRDTLLPQKSLPFLFLGDHGGHVLIHRGAIREVRGAAEVGAYLRDLGIYQPERAAAIDLYELINFLEMTRALPEIDGVSTWNPYYQTGPDADPRINARVEGDGETGRVIFHYFLPEPPDPPGIDYGDRPSPATRAVARAVLEIPRTGDIGWTVSTIQIAW